VDVEVRVGTEVVVMLLIVVGQVRDQLLLESDVVKPLGGLACETGFLRGNVSLWALLSLDWLRLPCTPFLLFFLDY
jgi:hypothetical protein